MPNLEQMIRKLKKSYPGLEYHLKFHRESETRDFLCKFQNSKSFAQVVDYVADLEEIPPILNNDEYYEILDFYAGKGLMNEIVGFLEKTEEMGIVELGKEVLLKYGDTTSATAIFNMIGADIEESIQVLNDDRIYDMLIEPRQKVLELAIWISKQWDREAIGWFRKAYDNNFIDTLYKVHDTVDAETLHQYMQALEKDPKIEKAVSKLKDRGLKELLTMHEEFDNMAIANAYAQVIKNASNNEIKLGTENLIAAKDVILRYHKIKGGRGLVKRLMQYAIHDVFFEEKIELLKDDNTLEMYRNRNPANIATLMGNHLELIEFLNEYENHPNNEKAVEFLLLAHENADEAGFEKCVNVLRKYIDNEYVLNELFLLDQYQRPILNKLLSDDVQKILKKKPEKIHKFREGYFTEEYTRLVEDLDAAVLLEAKKSDLDYVISTRDFVLGVHKDRNSGDFNIIRNHFYHQLFRSVDQAYSLKRKLLNLRDYCTEVRERIKENIGDLMVVTDG